MGLQGLGLLRGLGAIAATGGKGAVYIGSGLYNRLAAPITKKSLKLVAGAADIAADQFVKDPIKALYRGGALALIGSSAIRHFKNHSAIRNNVAYRYF